MPLRVAGAQLAVTGDIEANVAGIGRAIAYAKEVGADILLTPEGSLSGYTPTFDVQAADKALATVTRQAQEARVGLALGTCFIEPEDSRCYNQIRFYEPDGTYLGFHSKTLTCGTMEEPSIGEINHYAVRPLRTYTFQNILIGGLICNDMWANPGCTPMPDSHLSQQLSGMGARLLFHAVNGGRDGSEWSAVNWRFHEANLQMRARAGKVWVVTVDNCHPPKIPCSSPGGVIAPDGRWVCRTEPVGEQFFHYQIDLNSELSFRTNR
jgi:predicted amidohydrolase